jgi:RNA polymerase sigma-70 factor, ECF subfamily
MQTKQTARVTNDTEQVQRARTLARDAGAFRAIMQTHNQRLYRIAPSILRNNADAEDAVQQAYVSAFTNLASYRREGSIKGWLSRIVINESLGRMRQRHSTIMVFVTRVIEGMSIEETSELLGIKPETVKTRLHRARQLIRDQLEKEIGPVLTDAFPFAGWRLPAHDRGRDEAAWIFLIIDHREESSSSWHLPVRLTCLHRASLSTGLHSEAIFATCAPAFDRAR